MSGKGKEWRTTAELREQYRRYEEDDREKVCTKSLCTCNKKKLRNCLTSTLPCYRILKKYNWKTDFFADMICGITVGIMQLPQGMAYAMLAEMPPVVGLYMSFFPVLLYFVFGSSRHNSMGTVAVVSLLTGSVVSRFYDDATGDVSMTSLYNQTGSLNGTFELADNPTLNQGLSNEVKIRIAMSLSLLVGFTQIILGVLRMGFVTTYMSDPLVSGFTTATAIHVGTSQIKYILGLKIPRTDGLFQVVKTYVYLFERISHTNIPTLIVSIICIIILYLVKIQVNYRFKAKLKVPIPIELIVVIAGTLASHYGYFNENYSMKVVGEVPAGLPMPALPSFKGVNRYIADIPIIAIISFAQSVSLAAMMAKKHKYPIDSNQELIAYGAGNLFGSFFSCYPFAASVSRTSVVDSAGGKSQVSSLFSAAMVLVVILWLGPLFESLPNCILSSIIVVALRSLLLQALELPKIWRTSRFDFCIWMVTFLCATLLHVDYGLLIGLVFSFFTVVLRTQRAKPTTLGMLADEGVFKDPDTYSKTYNYKDIKIIGFTSPLYFANGDIFVKHVHRLSTVKPERLRKQIRRASQMSELSRRSSLHTSCSQSTIVTVTEGEPSVNGSKPNVSDATDNDLGFVFEMPLTHIILDFSAISFVDSVGCKILKQIIQDYENVNIKVFMAAVSDDIWQVFEATEILPKYKDDIFVSIQDAVQAARKRDEDQVTKNGFDKRNTLPAEIKEEEDN